MKLVLSRDIEHRRDRSYLSTRRNNSHEGITGAVTEMGLLETVSGVLRVPEDEDFEAVLHTAFVKSGGEAALARAREKFDRDRDDYRTNMARRPTRYRSRTSSLRAAWGSAGGEVGRARLVTASRAGQQRR